MGEWRECRLGDIGTVVGGGTPSRERADYWDGPIPWLTPGELTGNSEKYVSKTQDGISTLGLAASGAKLLSVGSLLITSRASIGSCALAGKPMATNQGFTNLTPGSDVDPSFLFHLGLTLGREMTRRASGTTFLEISGREFGRIAIWLPPLEEQRRIAEILDTIDETIQATERVIAKLELVRIGLLESSMPVGDLVQLKELASVSVGFVGPTRMHYTTPDRGVPFLRTGNIGTGQISSVNMRYVTHAFNLANQKSVLQEGDVVVSRVGYTGNAAVIEPSFAGVNCANMIIIRSGPRLESRFLSILFESRLIGQQVQAMTAGSAQPVFNIKLVERLRVPNVGSVEQLDTVNAIHGIDQLLAAERDSIRKLIATRAGLAADLLSGRVRTVAA